MALCRSGQAAPTLPLPAAPRSLQLADLCRLLLDGASQHCITAVKGGSHPGPPAMCMPALPLHSSSLGNKRGLSSLTSCAIFGPSFLLHVCPCSLSISVATAHVFSRQGALWSFPSLGNNLHIVMFKTQLPGHKYPQLCNQSRACNLVDSPCYRRHLYP